MTLFDRIGGASAVQVAVDHFYVRVLGDPQLAPFFEKTDIAHSIETLKGLGVAQDIIAEMVAALTPLAAEVVNTRTAGA